MYNDDVTLDNDIDYIAEKIKIKGFCEIDSDKPNSI